MKTILNKIGALFSKTESVQGEANGMLLSADFQGSVRDDAELRSFARFAAHVYGVYTSSLLPEGSSLIESHDTENGLNAKLYRYNDMIVCAFAGTSDLLDWINNATQLIGFSTQYGDALEYAQQVCQRYCSHEVVFVGHSLGGGEASYCAYMLGGRAVAFNPAAVSISTLLDSQAPSSPQSDIISLVFESDILNHIQRLAKMPYNGKLYYITDVNSEEHGIHGIEGILNYFRVSHCKL